MRFGFPKPGSNCSRRGRSQVLRPGVSPLEPRQLLSLVTVNNGTIAGIDNISTPPLPTDLRIDGYPTDPTASNVEPVAALGVQFTSPASLAQAPGLRVSYVGDVNDDGFVDFAISAPFTALPTGEFGLPQPSGSGLVYLVFGSETANPAQGDIESYLDLVNTFDVPDDNILARNDRVADITQLGQENQSTPNPNVFPSGNQNYAFDGLIFQTSLTGDDNFGAAVSAAGDLNDDGFADFAIGAPGDSSNRGRVVIVYGSATIDDFAPGLNLIDVDRTQPAPTLIDTTYIDGQLVGSRFGGAISPAGDVIDDGVLDLAIGAPSASINGPTDARVGNGAVYLISGEEFSNTPTSLDLSDFGTTLAPDQGILFVGAASGSRAGFALGRGGNFSSSDFDQADLLIGAPSVPTAAELNEGRLYVVFGSATLLNQFTTDGDDPTFYLENLSVTGGDQTIDGLVYSGLTVGERLGYSVSNAGDYNGDGQFDIIVGAPGFLNATGLEFNGRAILIRGEESPPASVDPIPLTLLAPDLEWTNFLGNDSNLGALIGASVGVTISLNNDTLPELLIGAPGAQSGLGFVYVVAGAEDSFYTSLVDDPPFPFVNLDTQAALAPGLPPTPAGVLPVILISGATNFRADLVSFFGQSVSGISPFDASPFRSTITVDSDTLGDILIGAPLDTPTYPVDTGVNPFSGGAFVIEGAFLPLGVPVPRDGGGDDNGGDDEEVGAGVSNFVFPPANAAAPPYGEALTPTPEALSGLPFYRPLPFSRSTYQQFLARPGFALRTRNFFFPDQAVDRHFAASKHGNRGIYTLPKSVFTRGRFQVGERTGAINHGIRTIPLAEFRALGGAAGLRAQLAALRARRV